jgi:hypothetical protein
MSSAVLRVSHQSLGCSWYTDLTVDCTVYVIENGAFGGCDQSTGDAYFP